MSQKKATIEIHLQPGAKSNEILGFKGDILYVKVTAMPTKGQANKALIDLLAKVISIPKSNIEISRGLTSRNKVLMIDDLDLDELRERLV